MRSPGRVSPPRRNSVSMKINYDALQCPAVTSERVLCHPSVGGLWPRAGGIPSKKVLTPKQQVNSGRLGGDWRSYKRGNQGGLVQKFMDLDSSESWSRVKEF
uniref:Uncharacterized protein n=1 Tax=Salix viminalis TaxID=40686 RepID=A0A6N2LW48_SALVM